MNRSRPGFKALGLCALVMAVMAVGTVGVAQAESGACWGYINASSQLKCFGESGLEARVVLTVESPGLTLSVEGLPEINCKAAAPTEGGKLTSNGSVTSGRVEFKECLAYVNGSKLKTRLASCDPVGGKLVTEKVHGLITSHELAGGAKDHTVLLLPDTGEILAGIHLNEECSLVELVVKGELVLWDTLGNTSFLEHKLTHLVEEFPGLHLMKVGVKTATLDGTVNVTLETPHNVLKWAGKPSSPAETACPETGEANWGYINAYGELKCFAKGGLEASVKLEVEEPGGTLLVQGLPEINCKAAALIEGGKLTSNGSVTSGRVEFKECLAYVNGSKLKTRLASCDPVGKTVTTQKAHGLIKLHELAGGVKDDTVLFLPTTGETLAILSLNEECATGAEIIVKGELVLWDTLGNTSFLEHKLTHLVEEFPGLHLMKVGVKTATLDGTVNVTLQSPHNALKWAGKPN